MRIDYDSGLDEYSYKEYMDGETEEEYWDELMEKVEKELAEEEMEDE